MVSAIFFDLDGTLIDSETFYVEETYRWLLDNGIDRSYEDACKIIGLTMDATYEYLSKLTGLSYDFVMDSYDSHFLKHPLDFGKYLFSDIEDTFVRLKEKGMTIAICSMSDREYVHNAMKDCHIDEYIDYYVGGNEVKRQKPFPDVYLKALEVLNVDRKNVIVVEDSTAGIKAGKSAGLYVVARNADRFKMDQSKADIIVDDLRELIGVIDRYE